MSLQELYHKPSMDDLEVKLNLLSQNNALSEESLLFIRSKIKEKKTDGVIVDFESEEIRELIYVHQEFYKLKEFYKIQKDFLTQRARLRLDSVFENVKITEIGQIGLKSLKKELNFERKKTTDTIDFLGEYTFRDFIEGAIDFTFFPESLFETKLVEGFYNKFTIKYLNLLEQRHNNDYSIINGLKNKEKGLTLSESKIKDIIVEMFLENKKEFADFHFDLNIKINGKKILFTKEDLLLGVKVKEVEFSVREKERKKAKRKKQLNKLLDIENRLISISNSISKSTHLTRKENYQELKNKFIKSLIETGSLTKKQILEIIKYENGFNESEFNSKFEGITKLGKLEEVDNKKIGIKKASKLLRALIREINNIGELEVQVESDCRGNNLDGNFAGVFIGYLANKGEFGIKFKKLLIELGDISVSELLKLSEYETFNSSGKGIKKRGNFNYLDFINNFGLTEKLNTFLAEIINKRIRGMTFTHGKEKITLDSSNISKYSTKLLHNLLIFNKIILGIESNGRNVSNDQGSGAESFFQLHTGDGENTTDIKKQGFNSFQTYLRTAYKYHANTQRLPKKDILALMPAGSGKLKNAGEEGMLYNIKPVPEWILTAYNTPGFNPKDLTVEQQNELILIYAFMNPRKSIEGKRAKEYIGLAMIGDIDGIIDYYKYIHHTNVDTATENRIQKFKQKFESELTPLFKKIIRPRKVKIKKNK